MHHDANGLALSTGSAAAAALFDDLVDGYLGYRADLAPRLAAVLGGGPGIRACPLLRRLPRLARLLARLHARPPPPPPPRRAGTRRSRRRASRRMSPRWRPGSPGELDRAVAIWEQHPGRSSARHPGLPARAFRAISGSAGRTTMLASVRARAAALEPRAAGLWQRSSPAAASRIEECGNYAEAEAAGRAAIELDPGDLWAAHGVAHVLEMQGRRGEGIAWIDGLRAALGGRQQHAASSVVAPRRCITWSARVRRGAGAVRHRLPRPRRAR